MQNLYPVIRNTARALIIGAEQVLLLRKMNESLGEHFALPGGAQELGESLELALKRECFEEIGVEVQVDSLCYLAEYFKPRNSGEFTHKHMVEFIFRCSVPADYTPCNGPKPDGSQIEVVWLPLASLDEITLYPPSMSGHLQASQAADRPAAYLGLID